MNNGILKRDIDVRHRIQVTKRCAADVRGIQLVSPVVTVTYHGFKFVIPRCPSVGQQHHAFDRGGLQGVNDEVLVGAAAKKAGSEGDASGDLAVEFRVPGQVVRCGIEIGAVGDKTQPGADPRGALALVGYGSGQDVSLGIKQSYHPRGVAAIVRLEQRYPRFEDSDPGPNDRPASLAWGEHNSDSRGESSGVAHGLPVIAKSEVRGYRKSTRLNSSHPSISYAVFC